MTGDKLTEKYVRTAAYAAMQLPVAQRPKAFTLGLAVAVADTDMFLSNSLTRDLMASLETAEQRDRRLEVIGAPTLFGRNDLARHFFFSAAMTTLSSASIAESAGLLKEMRDSQGESGFSFTDLAADLAGIALAEYVKGSEAKLPEVARDFSIAKFVPPIDGLRDNLTHDQFIEAYGSTSDPALQERSGGSAHADQIFADLCHHRRHGQPAGEVARSAQVHRAVNDTALENRGANMQALKGAPVASRVSAAVEYPRPDHPVDRTISGRPGGLPAVRQIAIPAIAPECATPCRWPWPGRAKRSA